MKNLIIFIFKLLGLRISGFHPIYITKSKKPRVIEFIGMGGKTYYRDKYCESSKMKKIRPSFHYNDLNNNKLLILLPIVRFVSEIVEFHKSSSNFLKKIQLSIERIIIQEVYSDYSQFWDEGLIKLNIDLIGHLLVKDQDLLKELLKSYILVVILPPFEVVLNRYQRRMTSSDFDGGFIDSLKVKYRIYEALIDFLFKTDCEYIFINGMDDKESLNKIHNFLETKINDNDIIDESNK